MSTTPFSNAICSGELKSGARITQEELAHQFGVSRQPVLQAMMLLRREGFLIDAGRKGVCVAPLDVQQARNLYVVRGALDGAAARLAAANYTPHLVQRGRSLLEVGRRAVASGNVPSVIEADIDFHLFIYEASGNPLIGETAQPHWQHLRRVMAAALGEERPARQRVGRARGHPARARGRPGRARPRRCAAAMPSRWPTFSPDA